MGFWTGQNTKGLVLKVLNNKRQYDTFIK